MADFEYLNCPYCCERLTIPTYQCLNGHVGCSKCWPKLQGRCPQCLIILGTNRCRSIENVIRTLLVHCPNQIHGCAELVTYAEVRKHILESCRHSRCYCPLINNCDYAGRRADVFAHYINIHMKPENQRLFLFGYEQQAVVSSSNSIAVYYSMGTEVLFVIQTYRHEDGIYISVAYIEDEESVFESYGYKIRYKCGDNFFSRHTLKMKSIKKVCCDLPDDNSYMYIPSRYSMGPYVSLSLCITKSQLKSEI